MPVCYVTEISPAIFAAPHLTAKPGAPTARAAPPRRARGSRPSRPSARCEPRGRRRAGRRPAGWPRPGSCAHRRAGRGRTGSSWCRGAEPADAGRAQQCFRLRFDQGLASHGRRTSPVPLHERRAHATARSAAGRHSSATAATTTNARSGAEAERTAALMPITRTRRPWRWPPAEARTTRWRAARASPSGPMR